LVEWLWSEFLETDEDGRVNLGDIVAEWILYSMNTLYVVALVWIWSCPSREVNAQFSRLRTAAKLSL